MLHFIRIIRTEKGTRASLPPLKFFLFFLKYIPIFRIFFDCTIDGQRQGGGDVEKYIDDGFAAEAVKESDEEIVSLFWSRDERALVLANRLYGRLVYHLCFNVLGDREESEECQNEVWLALWNAIPPARPAFLQGFLIKLTRRTAIDRLRICRAAKRVPSELTVSTEELYHDLKNAPSAEEEFEQKRLSQLISGFLKTLPARKRYVFMDRYYMAEPVEQIAKTLGITPSAVYKELAAIKKDLKKHLEENGVIL